MNESTAARNRIRSLVDGVVAEGMRRESFSGASDKEIDRYAAEQGVTRVPVAVRETFRMLGERPGLWFPPTDFGVHCGIDANVKQYVIQALEQLRPPEGMADPAGMLVLAMRQGYAYNAVDGADLDRDDPPIWAIVVDESARAWSSTSAWLSGTRPLIEDLRDELRAYERHGQTPPEWADAIVSRAALTPPAEHPAERIHELAEEVFAAGLRRDSVAGAGDAGIDRFAAAQAVERVPPSVREALRIFGARHGLWLQFMDFGVEVVDAEAKARALTVLRDDGHEIRDPAGILVIAVDEGTFYVLDGADLNLDDPPVWTFDDDGKPHNKWGSVSGWLNDVKPDIPRSRITLKTFLRQGRPLPPWAQDIEPE
ncbi:hypothetical protein [Actinoallomurus sp. CA-150999]|uniref:hypothetical protein n=1 Tax=Actinoallomurus sp. CA-150999 TaxID=3239887 RepID=UPI003D89D684